MRALHVLHDDRVHPGHRLLAEVAFRVPDRLAYHRPGPWLRHPAPGVQLRPPDQLVALEQVDQAVVGELRHQRLRHLAQGRVELQGPGQPLPDALKQAQLLPLPRAAPLGRLPCHDHDSGDLTARRAQRHGLRAHEDAGAVRAQDREGSLPCAAAQDLARQVIGLSQIAFFESERKERAADEVTGVIGKSEQPYRERIRVLEIAKPVGDDDAGLRLVQDRIPAQPRRNVAKHGVTGPLHRTAARPRMPSLACLPPQMSRPRNEHVHGDIAGQFRRSTANLVLTRHPHAVVARQERHLASRLYPYVL